MATFLWMLVGLTIAFIFGRCYEIEKLRAEYARREYRRMRRQVLTAQMHAHPGYYAFAKPQVNEAPESILSHDN